MNIHETEQQQLTLNGKFICPTPDVLNGIRDYFANIPGVRTTRCLQDILTHDA